MAAAREFCHPFPPFFRGMMLACGEACKPCVICPHLQRTISCSITNGYRRRRIYALHRINLARLSIAHLVRPTGGRVGAGPAGDKPIDEPASFLHWTTARRTAEYLSACLGL